MSTQAQRILTAMAEYSKQADAVSFEAQLLGDGKSLRELLVEILRPKVCPGPSCGGSGTPENGRILCGRCVAAAIRL